MTDFAAVWADSAHLASLKVAGMRASIGAQLQGTGYQAVVKLLEA